MPFYYPQEERFYSLNYPLYPIIIGYVGHLRIGLDRWYSPLKLKNSLTIRQR